ncbi:MAG: hypothetical protein IPK16_09590 [Anaerolineales bacterium]|nr:hypothetical protein [Anaerolineales bacterium]
MAGCAPDPTGVPAKYPAQWSGTWQANFSNVSAGAPTLGRIVASAAPGSTVAPQSVNVTFNGVALQQLTITQPMQGQTVSPTFAVIGTGQISLATR